MYHHDGDDAWRAIETMEACGLPASYRERFLGANARKLYNIEAPREFIRERVTEIERPDWWPTETEVQHALQPEAALLRPYGESGKPANGANGRANGANGRSDTKTGDPVQGARA
ncbi:MAG: hypothetical protein J4F42_21475 [Desulfurellaceae bacterium]|nr:hypothetical protein [Desulfurellaceae bacterium]